MQIKETRFKVVIKPNAKENKISHFDETRKAYIISIKEPAEDNKANKELIRLLTKALKKKVRIKSGLTSREKIIELE